VAGTHATEMRHPEASSLRQSAPVRQLIVALVGLLWLGCAAAGVWSARRFRLSRIDNNPRHNSAKRVKFVKHVELGYMIFMATVIALVAYAIA
jgi:hypothetical protein